MQHYQNGYNHSGQVPQFGRQSGSWNVGGGGRAIPTSNQLTVPAPAAAYSFPLPRSAHVPVRQVAGSWGHNHSSNEDYGNLVNQGFGSPYQGNPVCFGSPSSEICCSPSNDGEWISPMDDQPCYVSPKLLQSQWPPHAPVQPVHNGGRHHSSSAPTQMVRWGPAQHPSDSEEETVSYQYTPDSSSKTPLHNTLPKDSNLFEMELDEPSTTVTANDDEETIDDDEGTVDDESVDELIAHDLDTTVDYSFLGGAIESSLGLDDIPVNLPPSKTPCLDALAFCVVMRLGAYQTPQNEQQGSISVSNCQKFLGGIHLFCPKKSQTQNDEARIKALKRWFDGIPAKKKRDQLFVMKMKDSKTGDVQQIIKKLQTFCITHGYVPAAVEHTQTVLRPAGFR